MMLSKAGISYPYLVPFSGFFKGRGSPLGSDVWGIDQKLSNHQDPTNSNFLGTPGEDYFKGNPKSLNLYFLVIWWGKMVSKWVITYNLLVNRVYWDEKTHWS